MKVVALYLFPVKSLAPVKVDSLTCSEAGPLFDREWMLVDDAGKFLTQRELPRMALVQPELDFAEERLVLSAPGMSEKLAVSFSLRDKVPTKAMVWTDEVGVYDMGPEAAQWLSKFLEREVRLVRVLVGEREKSGDEARSLRLQDDYPLHVISLASLKDLNARLPSPIEALRFRPNIILDGETPWAEDKWENVKIGAATFPVGRACTRCAITTVNPATGEKGNEPLKTLAGFRRNAKNKIEFGLYLHSVDKAELTMGMSVTVS